MSFISDFYRETEALLLSCIQLGKIDPQTLRRHFVNLVLKRFLPPTIMVGSGKIMDYSDTFSLPQSLILYRSSFPVFSSNSGSKIFFVDSVLAVIDLMPSLVDQDLIPPFVNSASVKNLQIAKHHILATTSQEYMELAGRLRPKTFVVTYQQNLDRQSFQEKYNQAKTETVSVVPDGICILGDNGLYAQYDKFQRRTNFYTHNSFGHFFQHLLKILMGEINDPFFHPKTNATIRYDMSRYYPNLN